MDHLQSQQLVVLLFQANTEIQAGVPVTAAGKGQQVFTTYRKMKLNVSQPESHMAAGEPTAVLTAGFLVNLRHHI